MTPTPCSGHHHWPHVFRDTWICPHSCTLSKPKGPSAYCLVYLTSLWQCTSPIPRPYSTGMAFHNRARHGNVVRPQSWSVAYSANGSHIKRIAKPERRNKTPREKEEKITMTLLTVTLAVPLPVKLTTFLLKRCYTKRSFLSSFLFTQ